MRVFLRLCLLTVALSFPSALARAQTVGDFVIAEVPFCLSLKEAKGILAMDAEQGFAVSFQAFLESDTCTAGPMAFTIEAVLATYQVQRGGKEALMYIVQGKLGDDTDIFILTPVKVKTKQKDA